MEQNTKVGGVQGLHRVLGTRDLVLLNISAVVGLRWLSVAAQIGPSSLILWALGMLIFFLPLALVVVELSSRIPTEGGFYAWTKNAFGDMHGFIAGWTYWVANLVFFPSLLLFSAGVSLYVGGDRWLSLADSAIYNGTFCLVALWGATLLNIIGLERAKWLQNIGGIATWLAAALLLLGGGAAWLRFGSATAFTAAHVMPDFRSFASLATLATIALAYDGLELAPVLGGEIKEPRKTIPRAILISVVMIAAIYIAGTSALLVALPAKQIDLISGIPQALTAIGDRIGVPIFGPLTAGLVAVSNIGGLGAWISGTTRLPFVLGVDRYLPGALASLHPKYGTPFVSLVVQATFTTLVLLAAISGSTMHEAFVILIDLTLILTFVPLLYMFAALPVLRGRASGRNEGIALIPGGVAGSWLVSGLGFFTTLLAIVASLMPPEQSTDRGLFLLKVGGGTVGLIGTGLIFYARGSRRRYQVPVI